MRKRLVNTGKKSAGRIPNFHTVSQETLPLGRKGKHHEIVGQLLNDLQQLGEGRAIRIPLSGLPDSVAKVRSALNRATHQRNLVVSTSSDEEYFYIWKPNGHLGKRT